MLDEKVWLVDFDSVHPKVCNEVEARGLIYKMLRRNHPAFDLAIISLICVRVIHRMNIRTENVCTRPFQM